MHSAPVVIVLFASIGIALPQPRIDHPHPDPQPHHPAPHADAPIPVMRPNDNTRSSGKLENGALNIRLDAKTGVWYPEGPSGKPVETAGFAEEGNAPTTPGPVIRVTVG